MADALIKVLNSLGYQPFSMSRTNVDPPDVLTVDKPNMRIWGRLHKFYRRRGDDNLPTLVPSSGRSDDIEYQHTSKKDVALAASCLRNMLKCIGLTSVPTLNLSFCGNSRLTFSVTGVTYRRVDPVDLYQFFERFDKRNIPDEYVENGQIHVAYEYLYAERLFMQLESGREFKEDIEGDIGAYVNLGTSGEVSLLNRTTLEFTSRNGDAAAFAFRSGRLLRTKKRWEFHIHESALAAGGTVDRRLWVPLRGDVLQTAGD